MGRILGREGAPRHKLHVEPIPILDDNYAWLLRCPATGATAVADPAVAAPVLERVQALGGRLDWILLTHHHGDHVAEVPQVAAATGAKVAGNAADAHRLPRLDLSVNPGDGFTLGQAAAQVLDTPGHTRGHIAWAFVGGEALLCGDTLFSIGCGRLFEGSPAQMLASLDRLAALPSSTLVCCTHEYTLANLRFARALEPTHAGLAIYQHWCQQQRNAGRPTLPSRIGRERALNPFLRSREPALRQALLGFAPKFALAETGAAASVTLASHASGGDNGSRRPTAATKGMAPNTASADKAAQTPTESDAHWATDVSSFSALRRCKDSYA